MLRSSLLTVSTEQLRTENTRDCVFLARSRANQSVAKSLNAHSESGCRIAPLHSTRQHH